MLKLVRIFILSAFAANDAGLYDIINLVRKTSSKVDNPIEDEKKDKKD